MTRTYYLDPSYYEAASLLAGEMSEAFVEFTELVSGFKEYSLPADPVQVRSSLEHCLELLVLGVIWEERKSSVTKLQGGLKFLFRSLQTASAKNNRIKKPARRLYGLSAGAFLVKNNSLRDIALSLENIAQLIAWMEATGEYPFETRRLQAWFSYFQQLEPELLKEYLQKIEEVTQYFLSRSQAVLGSYTAGVDEFLADDWLKHRFSEDVILCGKKKGEYYLNMVGAELLNKAYRHDFLQTQRKLLAVPACMCVAKDRCQAEPAVMGKSCVGCSKSCQVNHLQELGGKRGFDVLIIPHTSTFNSSGLARLSQDSVGIIGVACVTSLINGGLMLRHFGIPAQCVLLEYSGCQRHWDPIGNITSINIERLEALLN